VREVADIVSRNQVHVAPRPHDLLGTLADTCTAKDLLSFQTRKRFVESMTEMIAAMRSGADNLAAMWSTATSTALLDAWSPGWSRLNATERNAQIRRALSGGGAPSEELLRLLARLKG